MDWTNILKTAEIPEPPGRQDAVDQALERTRQKAFQQTKNVKSRKKKTK